MSIDDKETELLALRRRQDDLFGQELNKCQLGISELSSSIHSLRQEFHTALSALSVQIAKLPNPIPLEELEKRFLTRAEAEKDGEISDKLIKMMQDMTLTFVTKEEARPIKQAIYSIFIMVLGSGFIALLSYLLKKIN